MENAVGRPGRKCCVNYREQCKGLALDVVAVRRERRGWILRKVGR